VSPSAEASVDGSIDCSAAPDAAALLAGAAALDSEEELPELHPASAIAETATMAAANLRLVFNWSP
jgi:hypothetical protein